MAITYLNKSEPKKLTPEEMEEEIHRLQKELLKAIQIREEMQVQLTAGGKPDIEDEAHPAHTLLLLGWEFVGEPNDNDHLGCYWKDPEQKRGSTTLYPLTLALGKALWRLYHRKTWLARVAEDKDVI